MEKNFNSEDEFSRSKKRKKHFDPYKRNKHTISKLKEYKKYLEYIEMVRGQGSIEY